MKRYALVVGISEYDSPNLGKLSKPANDAKTVAEVLRSQGDFQEVTLVNGTKAKPGWVDYQTFDAELTKFLQQAANQDALIYFTGHGFTLEESRFVKRGYLGTSSCKVKFKDKRIISQEEGFSFDDLNGLIQEANLSSLLMLLDCCHSGFLIEDDLVKKSLLAFSKNNYCLIAACRSFQEAYALKSKDHSVFTGELLESLLEKNARQGVVTALDVFGYIDRRLKNSGQEPIFLGMGGAIPIVSYGIATEVEPDETCPYQGLEAFTEATAQFFFGRQKDVEALWQKLDQSNFVPVIGASGSGKSSLVRAGLIPALKQSGKNWVILEPIKPGLKPLQSLEAALGAVFEGLENQRLLDTCINEEESQGLLPLIQALPEGQRVLLVVDQFEEVFTVSLPKQSRRFIGLLTQVIEVPTSPLVVVITMRADFVESCLHYEVLKDLIQNQAVYLSSLTGSDLTDAIAKPAAKQGYRLTPDLLAEIVKDTREEPGFLPLLQFALTKLWEVRDSGARELTSAAYDTIGRLAGALNSHADQIFAYDDYIDPHTGTINLSAKQGRSQTEQDRIRAIMLRLVRTSEGEKDTRQRQLRSTLVELIGQIPETHQEIELVLESLIKGRLLVSEQNAITLAHEALIKGWKRLHNWCQENRDLRWLRQRIEDAHKEWLNKNKDDSYLLQGGRLLEIREQWHCLEPDLPQNIAAFYRHSDAFEKQQAAYRTEVERIRWWLQKIQTKIDSSFCEVQQLANSETPFDTANKYLSQILEIKAELDAKRDELDKMPNSSDLTKLNEDLAKFEDGIQRFQERMKNSHFAAKWLDFNRERLVKSASDFALREIVEPEDLKQKVQQFEWDVDDYIDWLRYSLNLGKPIPLCDVDITPSLDCEQYIVAFRFIKTEKVLHQLPDQVAEEIERYIDYLIEHFSN